MEQSIELLEKCPSCTSHTIKDALECIDYTFSQDTFIIQKCESCGFLFTNPRPTEKEIGKYYQNPEYVSHTDTKDGLLFNIYALVKRYSLNQKHLYVSSLTKDHSILDYGAGTGDFANELAKHNWQTFAFEPDNHARTRIQHKNSDIKLVSSLNEIQNHSISVITLWHVLEHVHQLKETLEKFRRILNKNGHLVIAVPNHKSFDAYFYKSQWAAYDLPRHLYHFDTRSLPPLLDQFGFDLVSTKPMWFDSVYVSLLSEKNSSSGGILRNVLGWLRAPVIGTISNLKALFNQNRCSSIIYTFQKRH